MDKVRYGVIGIGNQGTFYVRNLFKKGLIDNGLITALCDIDKGRIDALKKEMQVEYFSNYIDMLDSKLCDAVIVAVPHYLHPEMVIECLKRDINVICDKPAGVYTKQVRIMNEFANTSKAKFAMMFNQRTNDLYKKMRQIILSGGIGKLQRVTWIITDWFRTEYYYKTGGWRATWDGEGGGVLINQCPHQLDLVQWVLGKSPKKVNGFCHYGKWHDIEVEDDVTAYFEYDCGATGVFITTTGETPGTNRFEVSGTLGKLVCQNDKLAWHKNKSDSLKFSKTTDMGFSRPEIEVENFELPQKDEKLQQHAGIINNFTNHLVGLEELFVDGKEGILGVELMNAIELSGWKSGKSVAIPVNEREYLRRLNKKRAKSKVKKTVVSGVENTSGTF